MWMYLLTNILKTSANSGTIRSLLGITDKHKK